MARLPRIVVPGQVLHTIQCGPNRQPCFFADGDGRYLDGLREATTRFGDARLRPHIRVRRFASGRRDRYSECFRGDEESCLSRCPLKRGKSTSFKDLSSSSQELSRY